MSWPPACLRPPTFPFRTSVTKPTLYPPDTAQDVRALQVDLADQIWAATGDGLSRMPADRSGWKRIAEGPISGPTYDLALDASGTLWVAAWNGLHHIRDGAPGQVPGIDTPVGALAADGDLVISGGPAGFHRIRGSTVDRWTPGCTRYLRRIQAGPDHTLYFATAMGLSGSTKARAAISPRRSISLASMSATSPPVRTGNSGLRPSAVCCGSRMTNSRTNGTPMTDCRQAMSAP